MELTSKVGILYGGSASYKTTNFEYLARSLYERTGKPSRLVSVEASSFQIFQPLVDIGVVEPLYIAGHKDPLTLLRWLMGGQWPTEMAGGEWSWKPTPPGKLSAYFFEGLSSSSELLLDDQCSKHRKISEKVVGAFEEGCSCGAVDRNSKDEFGRYKHAKDCRYEMFGHAAKSHYGFVQNELIRLLTACQSLPSEYIWWSAHEAMGEEKDTRKPIRGPAIGGSAKTDAVQKYCGTLIHCEMYSRVAPMTAEQKQGGEMSTTESKVRMWYKSHPDKDFPNIEYKAKTTVPAPELHKLEKEYPGGFFVPGREHGLDEFVKAQEDVIAGRTEDLEGWKAGIDEKFKGER